MVNFLNFKISLLNRPAPLGTKANSKPAMWGRVPNRAKKENIHTTESENSNFFQKPYILESLRT